MREISRLTRQPRNSSCATNWVNRAWLALVYALTTGLISTAQVPAGSTFDVASVKPVPTPSDGVVTGVVRLLPGGRLIGDQAQVRYIIQTAYGLKPYQIVGGPNWIETDHYQIDAKAEGDPDQQQLLKMLQSLLQDRFKLKTHQEQRDLPIYELIVAKSGLKFRPNEQTCADPATPETYRGPGQGPVLTCGRIQVGVSRTGGRLNGKNVPITELVRVLSNVLGRTVVDKTNVAGTFDMQFSFAPDQALNGLTLPPGVAPDPSLVTIFTAIEEQLGLKLQSAKGPVSVLVIDSIEKPASN